MIGNAERVSVLQIRLAAPTDVAQIAALVQEHARRGDLLPLRVRPIDNRHRIRSRRIDYPRSRRPCGVDLNRRHFWYFNRVIFAAIVFSSRWVIDLNKSEREAG